MMSEFEYRYISTELSAKGGPTCSSMIVVAHISTVKLSFRALIEV